MINRLISCLVAFWFVISSMAQQKVSYQRDYLYMVDKINGAFVKIAEEQGLKAPANELVRNLIRFLESKF